MKDSEILASLAIQMWTEHDIEDMAEEFRKLLMVSYSVSYGMTMWKELRVLPLDIWKGYLLQKKIVSTVMLQNF